MAQSLHCLLANSIDYAGLFPPCSLDLGRALTNQSNYVRSPDAWMLSAFVLPLAQFEAAAEHLAIFDSARPLRVSVLGPATASSSEFLQALRRLGEGIERLTAAGKRTVRVEQLEMAAPKDGLNESMLDEMRKVAANLDCPTFWEAPADRAEEIIGLLSKANGTQDQARPVGFKLRTGGVTADAFPSSRAIANALVAATSQRVPIKFTAGLHHPVRQYREEVKTKMYGFLNVVGAGVLTAEHGWKAQQCGAMLDCEDASDFRFEDDSFSWREWSVTADKIEQHRRLITSFGSCSFDDPREDLRELGLLSKA